MYKYINQKDIDDINKLLNSHKIYINDLLNFFNIDYNTLLNFFKFRTEHNYHLGCYNYKEKCEFTLNSVYTGKRAIEMCKNGYYYMLGISNNDIILLSEYVNTDKLLEIATYLKNEIEKEKNKNKEWYKKYVDGFDNSYIDLE